MGSTEKLPYFIYFIMTSNCLNTKNRMVAKKHIIFSLCSSTKQMKILPTNQNGPSLWKNPGPTTSETSGKPIWEFFFVTKSKRNWSICFYMNQLLWTILTPNKSSPTSPKIPLCLFIPNTYMYWTISCPCHQTTFFFIEMYAWDLFVSMSLWNLQCFSACC